MMLDRGSEGRILMNVYSYDGLSSTTNGTLWDRFMADFTVQEKSPDYFLGAGIILHDSGGISIDPSKYLRKVVWSYDMSRSIHTKLPMPPGSKLYMPHADDPEGHKEQVKLYQQMAKSEMYVSLLRPDLMYYASQLGKVRSKPS